MNILYLCTDPGIPIRGHKGASVHVRALCTALSALGHHVTLVTPRPGPGDGSPVAARVVAVTPAEPAAAAERAAAERAAAERAGAEVEGDARALAAAEAAYQAGLALLAAERFDGLYERYALWSDAGARLAEQSGLPLVVEVNAPLRDEAARYRGLAHPSAAAAVEARLFAAARAITVVSEPLRAYVRAHGVPAERIHVVPNAVDARRFHPAVSRQPQRAALALEGRFVVGFAGTARPWHDLDTLFNAFALFHAARAGAHQLPPRLLLLGDFPDAVRARLAERVPPGAATIAGPVAHEDVPGYLAAMDVAVSPHPDLDGFYFSPLKLAEYLACGVATVAADVAPVAALVEDGVTGLLYPPGDAAALAERLATLAADPALRTHLGWQGAARVLRAFTWDEVAGRVVGWMRQEHTWDEVAGRGSPGPHPSPPPLRGADAPLAGEGAGPSGLTAIERGADAPPILDEKLRRRLYRATRPDVAGPLLAEHLGLERAALTRLEVLKYKPRRRCVIAYDIAVDSGPAHALIGKVFRDERGARFDALQRALWAAGFDRAAEDGIRVAEPLGYLPLMRMLLQERAPGVTLDDLVDAPDFCARVRQSAAALARLHGSSAAPDTEYTLNHELGNLARFAGELGAWRPELAGLVARRLAWLRAWAARLAPAAPVPAHRDFYYSQLLFDGPSVTLIDFDLFAWADPAIDVANFAAHLRFLALQRLPDPHALDLDADAFVAEYVRRRAPALAGTAAFLERVAFHRAATEFRLLHVVAQRPKLAHTFEALLAANYAHYPAAPRAAGDERDADHHDERREEHHGAGRQSSEARGLLI